MIPKIIHYCWFGRGPMPKVVTWCIESWKRKCPDYELKLWNEDNFDVTSVPFVKQAYEQKKWAFVADYVRMYALYHEGGIYLDSDEYVLKSFDDLLGHRVVSCHEYYPGMFAEHRKDIDPKTNLGKGDEPWINNAGLSLCANPLMAEPHHPFIKDVLDYYNGVDFIMTNCVDDECCKLQIVGNLITKIGIRYGYRYNIKPQHLSQGILVLGPETFLLNSLFYNCKKSRVIHMCLGSWNSDGKKSWKHKFMLNHPSWALRICIVESLLRKIKYLFISEEKKKIKLGDYWS